MPRQKLVVSQNAVPLAGVPYFCGVAASARIAASVAEGALDYHEFVLGSARIREYWSINKYKLSPLS